MLRLLQDVQAEPTTLLDIGAGVGVLHHELLNRTARTATHVEAASAYVAAARAEAARRGHGDRIRFVHGDAVALAGELEPADLVTLDRVLCCYPDLEPLIQVTTSKARRYYAASFPHERWYMHAHTAWQNFTRRRAGNPFRTYVHSVDRIQDLLRAAGLRPLASRRTLAWEVTLHGRA
ncbi:MAG: methyltransferase domain-containing protein [Gemmatimonadales bacterium]